MTCTDLIPARMQWRLTSRVDLSVAPTVDQLDELHLVCGFRDGFWAETTNVLHAMTPHLLPSCSIHRAWSPEPVANPLCRRDEPEGAATVGREGVCADGAGARRHHAGDRRRGAAQPQPPQLRRQGRPRGAAAAIAYAASHTRALMGTLRKNPTIWSCGYVL